MCGVVGIVSNGNDVARDILLGMRSLQTRGKESAGLATYEGKSNSYHSHKGMGTVEVVFSNNCNIVDFPGIAGVGHVRYSTTGESTIQNAHPIESTYRGEKFFLVHNGNLIRYDALRAECKERGFQFLTETDTELIAALIHFSEYATFNDAFKDALRRVAGTYAIAALYQDAIYAARDTSGNRPLILGKGRGILGVFSETAACDTLGIECLREVRAGELLILHSTKYPAQLTWDSETIFDGNISRDIPESVCVFELIYFSRPTSKFIGRRMQLVREALGRKLWKEHARLQGDVVVAVPDSGNAAASGFAEASGIPLRAGLIRFHHGQRTFNEVYDKRDIGLRIKLGVNSEHVKGQRVFVIDDSLVRATTMMKVNHLLREAGTYKIFNLISSPPYSFPCYYGIDTYRVQDELAMARHRGDIDSIRKEIGADYLGYLSEEGMMNTIANVQGDSSPLPGMCRACFTGKYPIPLIAEK